jgi:CheY-like chemotaxis protein
MNGFEAAYKIKNTENLNNNTPIIAVTADTLLESKTYNLDCFKGVVLKPFKIENLKTSLLSVI